MKTKLVIIFLFFCLNTAFLAQDFRIISSNQSSIVIEYKPTASDTTIMYMNGEKFVKFNLPGTVLEDVLAQGKPQLHTRVFNVGVPSESGNTIQVISSDYTIIDGNYFPNPVFERDSLSLSPKYEYVKYGTDIIENEIVTFGEYGLSRSLQVQQIKVYPVQFNPGNKEIKLYNKIVFSVSFGRQQSNLSLITEDFLEGAVINWSVAKNWGIASTTRLAKVSASPLASGQWYRFETPEEGIYKIDRTFLQNLGIDVNALDPQTIKIYSNGGYHLSEDYLKPRPELGFEEIAVMSVGEGDAKFDAEDYILFYARGTEFWEYNKDQSKITRVKHHFSKKNYYWLTFSGAKGKRMTEKVSLSQSGAYQQPFTLSFRSYEKDSSKAGPTGREYYGDEFNSSRKERTYLTQLNDIIPGNTVNYRFRMINCSEGALSYSVYEGNNEIFSSTIRYGRGTYNHGLDDEGTASIIPNLIDGRSNLKFQLRSASVNAKAYIDYFEIGYNRNLRAVSDQLLFFSKDTTALIEYTVTNFSNSLIMAFDVTNYSDVKLISGASVSGGQIRFQANENLKQVSRYLAVNPNAYKTPVNGAAVANSFVRSNTTGTEMIVITNKVLKSEAERYVNYRNNLSPNKLSTSVFYVDEIINEFSAGMMDPTAIRDFLKFAYDNWQTKPFYVLLLGDGDYDYQNIIKEDYDKNLVPTYQTVESLDELFTSYSSDDFFARIAGNDFRIDLAIGRLCVQNIEEAAIVIDKIIEYENDLEHGLWRTNITHVADDGPAAPGEDDKALHTNQTEQLAVNRIPKYFDQNKIYLAAYPTVITGVGRRKPDVNKAIIDAVNNGTLILNYIGHGNPNVWSHEYVFERISSIPQLKNKNYFFLTAATCDFGRYDDLAQQSSTEIMVNMKKGGAIGGFTASRVVISNFNARLNDSLYVNLLSKKEIDGKNIRIGLAYFRSKQKLADINDQKFHLFGDPALRLNEPGLQTRIDSVNNIALNTNVQISALSSVKINGSVGNGSNYNGEVIVSVYDVEKEVELKEMSYNVKMPGGLIYRGRTNVTNGQFQTEFVVPKDISYENKSGKITAYFYDDNQDGIGFTDKIIVGGTNPNAVDDGKGPEIEIFFDDESFKDSYLVNPDFTLIAKISDQTGLNTTGAGIGHKLEGVLNDDDNKAIDFTTFFVGDLNSGGKSGVIRYKFTSMETGDHKIRIKAWDVFNNFSSHETYFSVISPESGLALRDIYNYPNPFSSNTTFTFQHNIGSAFNVKIKIYTITGRLIKEIEERDMIGKFARIDWDGRDNDGNQIANGTYLYKLVVESSDGSQKNNALGKLAVIR